MLTKKRDRREEEETKKARKENYSHVKTTCLDYKAMIVVGVFETIVMVEFIYFFSSFLFPTKTKRGRYVFSCWE